MSRTLPNGLMIPGEATLLDSGTRPGYGDEPAHVNYAIWFVDMISYKHEPAVILQVTTDKGAEKGCGVVLTRSMLQSMLSDIITRGSSIPVRA